MVKYFTVPLILSTSEIFLSFYRVLLMEVFPHVLLMEQLEKEDILQEWLIQLINQQLNQVSCLLRNTLTSKNGLLHDRPIITSENAVKLLLYNTTFSIFFIIFCLWLLKTRPLEFFYCPFDTTFI